MSDTALDIKSAIKTLEIFMDVLDKSSLMTQMSLYNNIGRLHSQLGMYLQDYEMKLKLYEEESNFLREE